MLKQRVLTALCLIPLVVAGVLFLPSIPFAIVSGCIFLWGLWEWSLLSGFHTPISRVGAVIEMLLLTFTILALFNWIGGRALKEGPPAMIAAFWCLVIVYLYRFPKDAWLWKTRTVGIIAGSLTLIPAWVMLVALQYHEPKYVLYILILVWNADIAAYFAGKKFGRHKLALSLSPGKSWEGVIAALLATILASCLGHKLLDSSLPIIAWIVLNLVTIIFSVVGDLFESSFKRMRNLKDSGSILPGHGGILDRIDSLTSAVPIFTIGLLGIS